MQDGDLCLIYQRSTGKTWLVSLDPNGILALPDGNTISLGEIINTSDYGDFIAGQEDFILLRPTTTDFIRHFRRKTQSLYEDDLEFIAMAAGVRPGTSVIEAGTGTGILTYHLASLGAHVTTYDIVPEHSKIAQENLRKIGLESIITWKIKDVRDGFDERNVDCIILDMPTPWEAVQAARESLIPGGSLVVFVPSWAQIEKTVVAMRRNNFLVREVFEIIRRDFRVKVPDAAIHPEARIIGFTGVIIKGIKLQAKDK